jgi:hypothetical protein
VIQLNFRGLVRIKPRDVGEARAAIRELKLQRKLLLQAKRQANETIRQFRQDVKEEEARRRFHFDRASVNERLRPAEELKRSATDQIDEIDRLIVELQMMIERDKARET